MDGFGFHGSPKLFRVVIMITTFQPAASGHWLGVKISAAPILPFKTEVCTSEWVQVNGIPSKLTDIRHSRITETSWSNLLVKNPTSHANSLPWKTMPQITFQTTFQTTFPAPLMLINDIRGVFDLDHRNLSENDYIEDHCNVHVLKNMIEEV